MLYTSAVMTPEGNDLVEAFRNMPDHAQAQKINEGLKQTHGLIAMATCLNVNVFCVFLERWAQATKNKAALEVLVQVDKEITEKQINDLYKNDE